MERRQCQAALGSRLRGNDEKMSRLPAADAQVILRALAEEFPSDQPAADFAGASADLVELGIA